MNLRIFGVLFTGPNSAVVLQIWQMSGIEVYLMEFLFDISKVAESGIQSVVSEIVHIRDDHEVSVYVDSFGYAHI